jgi:MFS family permease
VTWRGSFAPLTQPGFRAYWLGRTVSMFGNTLAPVAVAFGVLHIGGDAADLGLVLAARGVPQVLLLLFGGVISDRYSRQRLLVIACVLSGLVQALAAGLLISGAATVAILAVVEAIHGAVSAFTLPALAGVVPLVVPREQWQQANALASAGRTGAIMLGPALGGVIVATAGAGWGLAVDAATFVLAAAGFSRLHLPATDRTAGSTTLRDLREGWQEFIARTWLWVVVVAFSALNALYAGGWMTLGPVIAAGTIGPQGWGFALASMAVGMLVGTLLLLRITWDHPVRAGMAGALLIAIPIATLGLSPSLGVLLLAAFIGGIGFDLFSITWETAMQEHIPADRLSRVFSYDMLGSFVAIPVGQIAAGAAAEAFDPRPVALAASAAYIAIGTAALLTPSVWKLQRQPHARQAEPVKGP